MTIEPPPREDSATPETFSIHSINAYSHTLLGIIADMYNLDPTEIQDVVRGLHLDVVRSLAEFDIDYNGLRWALQPRSSHREIAFLFDSSATNSDWYGNEISKAWLPALRNHGPKKTAVSVGDIYDLPQELLWQELDRKLVRRGDFPRLYPSTYFAVYFTNVSPSQLAAMDTAIRAGTPAYLGYVDCSTWNLVKSGLFLPQVGLRSDGKIITSTDDMGASNLADYPMEEFGFTVVGVDETQYGILLDHKIDNRVPDWADEDSAIALSALGGERNPISKIRLRIDDSRIEYLMRDHSDSMRRAGLEGLNHTQFAKAIQNKIAAGLIFNLRSREGTRDGARAPENDALMFTVQVEFPDETGLVHRYQVGVKYDGMSHEGEIATFF